MTCKPAASNGAVSRGRDDKAHAHGSGSNISIGTSDHPPELARLRHEFRVRPAHQAGLVGTLLAYTKRAKNGAKQIIAMVAAEDFTEGFVG